MSTVYYVVPIIRREEEGEDHSGDHASYAWAYILYSYIVYVPYLFSIIIFHHGIFKYLYCVLSHYKIFKRSFQYYFPHYFSILIIILLLRSQISIIIRFKNCVIDRPARRHSVPFIHSPECYDPCFSLIGSLAVSYVLLLPIG